MCAKAALDVDSVAVIGAGPCGLAAAKYLVAEKKFSRIEVFEQRDTVGGVWTYSPLNVVDKAFTIPRTEPSKAPDAAVYIDGCDAPKFVSPVYEFLETNIPHTLMNYSDQKFPENTSLFPAHSTVKTYLEDYAQSLHSIISLSTQVQHVRKVTDAKKEEWEVALLDLRLRTTRKAQFDAVIVASGHYNDPFIPEIPGLVDFNQAYPGSVSHSKFYRNPSQYKNKKVIIVGNSASGIDLSSQIATVCSLPVIVSEKTVPSKPLEHNSSMKMTSEIRKFEVEGQTVHFLDGHVERGVDAVIFCTGYFYTYPFLDEQSPPIIEDGSCAQGLYEHILYISDPTLAFIGIPQRIVPFPVAEAQSAWVARIWADRLAVPFVTDMVDWEKQIHSDKGKGKSLHNLGFPKDVQYINMLHKWSMAASKRTGLENEGVGKVPPYWDSEAAWVREQFPLIKLASRKLGDKRQDIKSLADLGFVYVKEKVSKTGEKLL